MPFNFYHLLYGVIALLLTEGIASIVFKYVRKYYAKTFSHHSIKKSIFHGILERSVLFIGLLYGFQSIIIMFGTIKIATRIKDDNKERVSNDYFIVGNLLSVLFVFISLFLFKLLNEYFGN